MRNNETKLQKAIRESVIAEQKAIAQNDALEITEILTALQTFDVEKAQELVKKPNALKALIQKENGLVCLYAVHAVMLALIGTDCTSILNDMTDEDIVVLKECISTVNTLPCPTKSSIDSQTNQRIVMKKTGLTIPLDTNGQGRKLSQNELWVNDQMLKLLRIYTSVHDLWQDSVSELNKWSNAIATFQRVPANQNIIQKYSPAQITTVWKTEDLASFIGVNPYLIRKANYSLPKNLKNTWFGGHGRGRIFFEKYKQEYKNWFISNPRRSAQIESQNKQIPVVEPETKPVIAKPKTLLDVKAAETKLRAVIKLFPDAKSEWRDAADKLESVNAELKSETDNDKIMNLIDKVSDADKEVKQKMANLTQCVYAIELLRKLQHDQQVIAKGQKNLETTRNTIAEFLAKLQQNEN